MSRLFDEIREGEEYAICSMRMDVYTELLNRYQIGLDFELRSIKQKNKKHVNDATILFWEKEIRKGYKAIEKREQELNHKK